MIRRLHIAKSVLYSDLRTRKPCYRREDLVPRLRDIASCSAQKLTTTNIPSKFRRRSRWTTSSMLRSARAETWS